MKKRRVLISILCLTLVLGTATFLLISKKERIGVFKPTLTVVSPQPVKAEPGELVTVDITLSKMPKEVYPGASINVSFDSKKLEFVGLKQGDITVPSPKKGGETIPIWECNIKKSNENGEIKGMFIDMSGGKYGYGAEGFHPKEQKVLLRAQFKLTENVKKGESYELIIEDAVFATLNNEAKKNSLSLLDHKLDARNGKIKMK